MAKPSKQDGKHKFKPYKISLSRNNTIVLIYALSLMPVTKCLKKTEWKQRAYISIKHMWNHMLTLMYALCFHLD